RNLWHLTPGPADRPETLFLGADPHLLFRSDDHGRTWNELRGLTEHPTRDRWNPGAGGPCVHTILLDPAHPGRLYVGISAAGTFRSDDLGESFRPVNRGVRADFQPDRYPEVGQCVHKIALDPKDPSTIYRQDHCGMYLSRDGMNDGWTDIGRGLPSRFGFGVATAAALPGRAFFLPLDPRSRTTLGDGLQVYEYRDRERSWRPRIRGNPFPAATPSIGRGSRPIASTRPASTWGPRPAGSSGRRTEGGAGRCCRISSRRSTRSKPSWKARTA
ncbi:glycosyl hydrolase BNR repeat-containing, partial [mine drainage metagenome]